VNKPESPQGDKPAQPRPVAEPRYVQVANQLRAGIAEGRFAGDGRLPTENALCERYGVSRFTVREALRRLQAEGLIRRRRGSGTSIDAGVPAPRQPISDIADLSHYAAGSFFNFHLVGPMTMGAVEANALGLIASSRWIHLSGTRRHDVDSPIMAITDVYIHADLAAHVPGLRPGKQTLFSQLAAAAGFRIGRVDQDLRALPAGSREASALDMPRRAPVLRITRVYRDTEGRAVQVSI
jgi:GntR family transcriptional regulator